MADLQPSLKDHIALAVEALSQADQSLTLQIDQHTLELTQLDKTLWVREAPTGLTHLVTKRSLLLYYASVAAKILPHLQDRPLTIKRYPEGLSGMSFIQRHIEAVPDFLQTVEMYSDAAGSNKNFLLCQNLASLLWLVNLETLEFHPWYSRINPAGTKLPTIFINSTGTLELSVANYPDLMVFDLDPSLPDIEAAVLDEVEEPAQAAFNQARAAALLLRQALTEYSLDSFVKTSGKTGLHVVVPIERCYVYDQVREAARRIGHLLTEQHPTLMTMEWQVPKRQGKVFFDYNQNARGKSLASPYSLRPTAQASLSMPLTWSEVEQVKPHDFTIDRVVSLEVAPLMAIEPAITTSGEVVESPAATQAMRRSALPTGNRFEKPKPLPTQDPWRDLLKHAQKLPAELLDA